MQVNVPVNLRIVPKVKQSGDKKILAGIESFMLGIPLIIKELEKRTLKASQKIAPNRTGGLADSIEIQQTSGLGFSLSVSPDDYTGDSEVGQWATGNPVRGIMMEFGYPYKNYWGPYHPNPRTGTPASPKYTVKTLYGGNRPLTAKQKRDLGKPRTRAASSGTTKLKGLGYMRIAYVVAARSLTSTSISYSGNGVGRADVVDYVGRTEKELIRSIRHILANYLRGGNLPSYLRRKSFPATPAKVPIGSVTAYGEVKGLNLNLSLNIQNDPYYDGMRTGANLYGANSSLNRGNPAVEGYEFLRDLPF